MRWALVAGKALQEGDVVGYDFNIRAVQGGQQAGATSIGAGMVGNHQQGAGVGMVSRPANAHAGAEAVQQPGGRPAGAAVSNDLVKCEATLNELLEAGRGGDG